MGGDARAKEVAAEMVSGGWCAFCTDPEAPTSTQPRTLVDHCEGRRLAPAQTSIEAYRNALPLTRSKVTQCREGWLRCTQCGAYGTSARFRQILDGAS